jgi:hypothetical protein
MSAALDLYRSFGNAILFGDVDRVVAWDALRRAAAEWRAAGRHFSAAFAMDRAAQASWGDGERLWEAVQAALEDCRRCVQESELDSLEALAAISLWQGLLRYYAEPDVRSLRQWLLQELADRLLYVFGDRPDSVGFLVRGVILRGTLDGDWSALVPDHVTVMGTSYEGADQLSINLASAFALLRRVGDRATLRSLVERFPEEFESVSLRGWKLAIEAEDADSRRAELFAAAADAFAADVNPTAADMLARPRVWSGENVHIWAKYFRARAALARIPATPQQAREYIGEALSALQDTWSGIVNEDTYRLHIALKTLGALVGLEDQSAVDEATEHLGIARTIFGKGTWHEDMERFLADTTAAFHEFANDPATALASARVLQLQSALAGMPAIGADVASGVAPAIGAHAVSIMRGLDRSYIHRALENIEDERVFQQIFLRLAQAAVPRYAQVRQGPLEYGKDVVSLVEESGRMILRMYQLKVGDIDMRGWRAVVPQLEEIFTVPLETIHIDGPVDERVGFLVCNGHANPHVDPAILGWFEQEQRDHGHKYEFMHLDVLVRWIVDDRLYETLRAALRDAGIAP